MGYAEARGCRRLPLLAYFGERLNAPCGCCDRCVPRVRTTAAHEIIRPVRKRRCDEIGGLFQAGHTLEQIAQRYSIQRSTVLANLCQFQHDGGRLDARRLLDFSALSEGERSRVLAAFERLGLERLAPVHETLAGAIGYDELHLLRLYHFAGRWDRGGSSSLQLEAHGVWLDYFPARAAGQRCGLL